MIKKFTLYFKIVLLLRKLEIMSGKDPRDFQTYSTYPPENNISNKKHINIHHTTAPVLYLKKET
jgi:hypothetical protein